MRSDGKGYAVRVCISVEAYFNYFDLKEVIFIVGRNESRVRSYVVYYIIMLFSIQLYKHSQMEFLKNSSQT